MASPYLYAFLSIIPGMGLFFLREYLKAGIVSASMIFLGYLALYVENEYLGGLAFLFFFLVWFGQGQYAYQLARRNYSIEIGESNLKPFEKVIIPSGLSLTEKTRYRWKEYLRQQLDPGEELEYNIMGTTTSYWFNFGMRQFLIGKTGRGLVFLELDILGKPNEVTRYRITEIEGYKLSGGPLNIKTLFWFSEKKKPLVLLVVNKLYSTELDRFKELFSSVIR